MVFNTSSLHPILLNMSPLSNTVIETGLSLLHQAKLQLSLWTYAFKAYVYLINRLPIPIFNNKSPFECLFHTLPNYSKLKAFGCWCYPWLRPYIKHKLEQGQNLVFSLGILIFIIHIFVLNKPNINFISLDMCNLLKISFLPYQQLMTKTLSMTIPFPNGQGSPRIRLNQILPSIKSKTIPYLSPYQILQLCPP